MEDSLRLDCATLDGVDNDHRTIGNTESRSHSRWKTGCLRRDCRHTVSPQRLSEKGTRLPQQDVIHDASTSGVAETSGMRCSAGLCRDTKPESPQRQGSKIRLPRQRVRKDAATSHPSGSTVHPQHLSRCIGRKNNHDVRNLSAARRLVASDAREPKQQNIETRCQFSGWCPVLGSWQEPSCGVQVTPSG